MLVDFGEVRKTFVEPSDERKRGKYDDKHVNIQLIKSNTNKTPRSHNLSIGLPPTLVGIIPARATYFWSYEYTKKKLKPYFSDSSVFTPLIAGVSAGIFANSITNPIWMVKTRMQVRIYMERRRRRGRAMGIRCCLIIIN